MIFGKFIDNGGSFPLSNDNLCPIQIIIRFVVKFRKCLYPDEQMSLTIPVPRLSNSLVGTCMAINTIGKHPKTLRAMPSRIKACIRDKLESTDW
ncbi:hypothetical protein TNCV_851591 [Trichonephila clavipes]|nr:hypothetical protein TNCV_851591 [Trichonephila clavipes]